MSNDCWQVIKVNGLNAEDSQVIIQTHRGNSGGLGLIDILQIDMLQAGSPLVLPQAD